MYTVFSGLSVRATTHQANGRPSANVKAIGGMCGTCYDVSTGYVALVSASQWLFGHINRYFFNPNPNTIVIKERIVGNDIHLW